MWMAEDARFFFFGKRRINGCEVLHDILGSDEVLEQIMYNILVLVELIRGLVLQKI
jgi:hypothetical protein